MGLDRAKLINKFGILKFLFTLLIFFVIFARIDRKKVWEAIIHIDSRAIFALFLLYFLGQILSALKWKIFLIDSGVQRSSKEVIFAYLSGMIVNIIGLGTVGGDMLRALALKPEKGERAKIFGTVVGDRIHGLLILSCIGLICLTISGSYGISSSILLSIVLVATSGVVSIIFFPQLVERFLPERGIYKKIRLVLLHAFPHNKIRLLYVSCISVASHLLQLLKAYLIVNSIGASIPFIKICSLVPFINIASALPISYSGLGVRGAMFIAFFVPGDVTAEQAVAYDAIWFFSTALCALFAAILVLLSVFTNTNNKLSS